MRYDDEAFLQRRFFQSRSSLALSPDGKWVACPIQGLASGVSRACGQDEVAPSEALWDELQGSEVVMVERCSGQVTRPFSHAYASLLPAWSPDGQYLALLIQEGERRFPRLAVWSPQHAALRVFEAAPMKPRTGFQALRWTNDSQSIVFKRAAPPESKPLVVRQSTDETALPVDLSEELAVLDVTTGQVRSLGDATGMSWRLSPDSRRVAFLNAVEQPPDERNNQSNWCQLVVTELDTGSRTSYGEPQTDNWGCSFSWSPDGNAIAWPAIAHHSAMRIHIAEVGEAPGWHSIDLPEGTNFGFRSVGWYPHPAPLWDMASTRFWLPGKEKLWSFSRAGEMGEGIALPEGPGYDWLLNSITALDTPRFGQSGMGGNGEDIRLLRPNEVLQVNPGSGTTTVVWTKEADAPPVSRYWSERAFDAATNELLTVTSPNQGPVLLWATWLTTGATKEVARICEEAPPFDSGIIHSLSWQLPDGTACAGSLLLPVDWREGDTPPVVMNVYGDERGLGDLSAARFHDVGYIVDAHLLSAHGYAVFAPDMPQTDEEPFASLVAAGEGAADALRAGGMVDAERIVVMGSSYGGYTTACLLTGSKRFCAGIVSNGLYNLIQTGAEGGWGYLEKGQGRMGVPLWENPQRYLENSPFFHLDKLDAPLLILAGAADKSGEAQAAALFSGVKRLAGNAEMLVYRDQGHAPTSWTIAAQRDLHTRLLDFLQRHTRDNSDFNGLLSRRAG